MLPLVALESLLCIHSSFGIRYKIVLRQLNQELVVYLVKGRVNGKAESVAEDIAEGTPNEGRLSL